MMVIASHSKQLHFGVCMNCTHLPDLVAFVLLTMLIETLPL